MNEAHRGLCRQGPVHGSRETGLLRRGERIASFCSWGTLVMPSTGLNDKGSLGRCLWYCRCRAAELQALQRHEVKRDHFEHGLARLSLVETVDIDTQIA